jgi:hypothetical protein
VLSIGSGGEIVTTDEDNKPVNIATEKYVNYSIGKIPIATNETAGLVKTSNEIGIENDALTILTVPQEKVEGLQVSLGKKVDSSEFEKLA